MFIRKSSHVYKHRVHYNELCTYCQALTVNVLPVSSHQCLLSARTNCLCPTKIPMLNPNSHYDDMWGGGGPLRGD